jgi:hypothetical protein
MMIESSGSASQTMVEPTSLQSAAIASGGGIWGDPAVELSAMGGHVKVNDDNQARIVSKKGNAIVMGCIAFSTGIASFLAGVITIAIPVMAVDLDIPEHLVLW